MYSLNQVNILLAQLQNKYNMITKIQETSIKPNEVGPPLSYFDTIAGENLSKSPWLTNKIARHDSRYIGSALAPQSPFLL